MNRRILDERGWPCPTGEEMRAIDRMAIERIGHPAQLLMENAGRAVARAVRAHDPAVRRPLVIAGVGNNGGDGFVVARVLREWDDRVAPATLVFGDPERLSAESRANLELLRRCGGEVVLRATPDDLLARIETSDLTVDALFGVGLSRPVEGELAEVLGAAARVTSDVVAIDLPSGTSSDTGETLGVALPAALVVTLGLPKLGLAVRPSEAEVIVADIGIPEAAIEAVSPRQWLWTPEAARARLPARPLGGHKGTFGHVLVVAGSEGKTGAACLAAEGALRAGAGLVTVAAPRALNPVLEVKLTEAMTLPLEDKGHGLLTAAALDDLAREAASRDALVIGPGVGTHPGTARAVEGLLAAYRGPAIVDADGLNVFSGRPEALRGPGPRVLTPHPGEMSRLLDEETAAVQRDRVGAARRLAERARAVVLLKGARSVTAEPDGEVRINPTGGPGLASGGTGDVLAGVIGALLAQGAAPFDAAALGAWLHGRAGEPGGPVGSVASEVSERLPAAWRELRDGSRANDDDGLRRFP